MNVREWSLVTFSILVQMAVGSFLVLGLIHFYATRKANQEEADRMSDRALLAIGGVLVLGMGASLFHLGNPLNSYRSITNVANSWLSREILSLVLFLITGGVFALMQWRKIATFAVRNVVAWIAAAIGLVLVFSMSNIYMLETQPSWNTLATPISFFSTTLLLGMLAIGASMVANYAYIRRKQPECADTQCTLLRGAVRGIALASVLLLGVEFVMIPMYWGNLSSTAGVGALTVQMLVGEFGLVSILRLVFIFLGAGLIGSLLYQFANIPGKEKIMGDMVYAAFALVLISEVMGRFLFYATQVQIGI